MSEEEEKHSGHDRGADENAKNLPDVSTLSPSNFEYDPLDDTTDSIRLLKVLPGD
jgi:hypothetical protein